MRGTTLTVCTLAMALSACGPADENNDANNTAGNNGNNTTANNGNNTTANNGNNTTANNGNNTTANNGNNTANNGVDLFWYTTCGDPVCGGHVDNPGVAECATVPTAESPCTTEGETCDPGNDCNSYWVCSTTDPKTNPGGCPISRTRFKTEITYVDEQGRQQLRAELMGLPLATYSYKQDASSQRRLGFLLEDVEPSYAADSSRDRADLYGYLSMAVATIQLQQAEIEALKAEVEALKHTSGASPSVQKP